MSATDFPTDEPTMTTRTAEPLERPTVDAGLRSVRQTANGTRLVAMIAHSRPSHLQGFVRRSEPVWAWAATLAVVIAACLYAVAQIRP